MKSEKNDPVDYPFIDRENVSYLKDDMGKVWLSVQVHSSASEAKTVVGMFSEHIGRVGVIEELGERTQLKSVDMQPDETIEKAVGHFCSAVQYLYASS